MPYPNEHSARVKDPDSFQKDSFRRKNIAPGIDIVMGKPEGDDSMTAQAYRFDKEKFTPEEAKAWLKENNIEYISFEPASLQAGQPASKNFSGRILAADKKDYGWKWHVQIIEAGEDKMGRIIYPLAVLHAASSLYENAKVFALSDGQHSIKNEFGHSVRDLVGRIQSVSKNPAGLAGDLLLLKTANNQWLRDALVDAYENNMIGEKSTNDILGLSHDTYGSTSKQGGKFVATKIVKVNSVDVVYEPIAGGKFLRMAAAAKAGQKEVNMWKKLLAALKGQRPDLKGEIEALETKGDDVTEEEINKLLASAVIKPDGQKDDLASRLEEVLSRITTSTEQKTKEMLDKTLKEIDNKERIIACTSLLGEELISSGLPDLCRNRIRRQFDGKIFEADALKAAIKEEKEIVDKLTGSGTPEGVGGLRSTVTEGEPERLQAALDKLFDVDVKEKYKDVPAFTSLRSAYVRLTGDTDLRGTPSREGHKLGEKFMEMMRLPAAYSTVSFTYVLGNSMYRRLIKEYLAVEYLENILFSYIRNAENFKTMEIIQIGYFGDIPDVNPETADYVEVSMPTDIEATYTINQKGVILSVTRKAFVNDDLKSVTQLVSKLGRAFRRTHAKRAWAKIIDNGTYKGDNKALFHTDHANLGATTLTADATGVATITARLKAMYAQTEQDSSEVLGLVPKYMWVPRDIREIAEQLNSQWPGATVNNPHAGKFGATHERIITNPLMTDANDWGLIADGNDVELLEAAYLNNQREPEFFVADNPLIGQMFVADKIQYKGRHEYEFEIADYRGFDKAVV